jgi:outer membrane protein assembly factor BamB
VKKIFSILFALVLLSLVLSPVIALMPANTVQAQPADSAWPMFGQNSQRTGRSPYSGPEVPKLKWSFTTGDEVLSSPAIGADGTIYVGSKDGKFCAINPDGSPKWSFTTGGMVSSPAIGADGTIYVGSNDGKFYAINPDGSPKWSFATAGRVVDSSPAIGADGTIYVGFYDGKFYAINPDGSPKWSFTTGDWVHSSPAIEADGTIYVGSNDHKLYAINPDGSPKWSFTTGGMVSSSPAIGADGTIYVGSFDDNLYAINPDGSQKWSFATGDMFGPSSPAIGADGTIYVGSWDNNLYAINPDGSQKWSFATGRGYDSSPAIGADGTIYIGAWDNNLYAINPDGSQKWSFTTGDWVFSSPAIGADGTIYVGSGDNNLYAITKEFDLTISSTAGGSVTAPGEGTFPYDRGTVVDLVAEAEDGYSFVNWTGDVDTIADVEDAETTITMNGDYSITARFLAGVEDFKTQEVTDGTVDARDEAGTEVEVAGTATVTVARYDENPGGGPPVASPDQPDWEPLGKYIDVYSPDTREATELEIRLYYTDDELTAADIDEESLLLFWWDGEDWVQCSDSGVNTDSNYMWAKIRTSTIPSLTDLQGTPWGGYGHPKEKGCFIATAAYGTDTAEELDILREFRDMVLLPNSLGARFVSLYYRISPPIAGFISRHEVLRTAVRVGFVDPIVKTLNWTHGLWAIRGS